MSIYEGNGERMNKIGKEGRWHLEIKGELLISLQSLSCISTKGKIMY